MRHALTPLLLMMTSLAGFAFNATGQVDDPPKVVEQGVSDVGPLSMSLRHIEAGLQTPAQFEQVRRVPGRENLFMRSAGGLYAIFPQSQYLQLGFAELAIVPAGTVFHIGPPEANLNGPVAAAAHFPDEGDTRIRTRIASPIITPDEPDPQTPAPRRTQPRNEAASDPIVYPAASIIADSGYRRSRLRRLMLVAGAAEIRARAGDRSN